MISDVFNSVSVVEFSNYPVIKDKIFLCTKEQINNEKTCFSYAKIKMQINAFVFAT